MVITKKLDKSNLKITMNSGSIILYININYE